MSKSQRKPKTDVAKGQREAAGEKQSEDVPPTSTRQLVMRSVLQSRLRSMRQHNGR